MSMRPAPFGIPVSRWRPTVRPADCALAVAIPLDPDEFLRQAADPRHEFIRSYISMTHARFPGLMDGPEPVWIHFYQPVVQCIEAILDDIAACGVEVVRDATAATIADLTNRFGVVSIFGHAAFPYLRETDLLNPSTVFLALTGQSPLSHAAPTQRWLIERLRADLNSTLPRSEKDLCGCFTNLIKSSRDRYYKCEALRPPDPKATLPGEAKVPWTAATMYEAFPDAIAPPVAVEMGDGLLDLNTLANLVGETFCGTLEFLACSAWWFAEFLRRERPACGDILGVTHQADAQIRMAMYRAVIQLLVDSPMPYTDAVTAIHTAALLRTDAERAADSVPDGSG